MRVLTFSWEYPPIIEGGLARHVRKLSEQLVAAGAEVHVVTRSEATRSVDALSEEVRHGVIVHRVPAPPMPRDIEAFLRWVTRMNEAMRELGRALAADRSFDLIHSHDWLVADAARATARVTGRPWIVTVHATEYGRHQGWVDTHPQSFIHAAERAMVRDADHVITCSRYMRSHVARVFGVPARRITALQNGIDADDLEPVAADLDALRAEFAAPGDQLVLLVGRLVYEKGFHLALDALAPIIRRRQKVRFVVAGTGTAEAELRRQAWRLGLNRAGRFLGWVGDDKLHSLYRIADLCIVPSIYEPFGIVALEAMASGCLCVVADTGGLREVIPGDGTVGLRFPSRDSSALQEILERVLGDDALRRQLVSEAREHVLRFDWARVARDTSDVYTRVLAPELTPPAR
jgi:glycogen(starch) synthase